MRQWPGLDATDWTWAARLNDLDNDGWIDAFFTNGIARADEMNPDLRAERETTRVSQGAEALLQLIRTQPMDATQNLAFRNTGQLSFEDVSEAWGLGKDAISYAAAQVDIDGDGDLELIVNNHNQPVSIYNNQESDNGRLIVRLRGQTSNRYGIGAKLTLRTRSGIQVRQMFTSRGYMTSDEPMVHFGLGRNPTTKSLTVEWPSGHQQVFDQPPVNHALLITEPAGPAAPSQNSARVATMFEEASDRLGLNFQHNEFDYDDYELQPLLPGKLSQLGPGVAWGDANGDGLHDVYVGGAAGQSGQLYVNLGESGFRATPGPWADDASSEDMGALWFDADLDGDQDLLVSSGSSEFDPGDPRLRDRLYLNDGGLKFQRASDNVLDNGLGSSSAVAAADFDRDGDLDLFIGERSVPGEYPITPRSYLLRNVDGRFEDVTERVAPYVADIGLVTAAVWE